MASVYNGSIPLTEIDLSDPSGKVRAGEEFAVRDYSGRTYLFVVGTFEANMLWRRGVELTRDRQSKLQDHQVRFSLTRGNFLIKRGQQMWYQRDDGQGFREISFMVSEIWRTGY